MWLHIVRHGQSMANVGKGITPNDGLTELGLQQAESVAAYFKERRVTHIFSSPFKRVIQTATPTAIGKELPLVLIPELSEIFDAVHRRDYPYEGCEQLERIYPHARFTMHHDKSLKWWPDYPETEEVEVRQRVMHFYDRELVPLLGEDSHVLVFGHGATTAALRGIVHREDTRRPSGNAEIFQYELDSSGCCSQHRLITEHLPTTK